MKILNLKSLEGTRDTSSVSLRPAEMAANISKPNGYYLKFGLQLLLVLLLSMTSMSVVMANTCENRVNNTTNKLLECLTFEGLFQHLEVIQQNYELFKDQEDGATAGSLANDANINYIVETMEAAGYNVTMQPIRVDYWNVIGLPSVERVDKGHERVYNLIQGPGVDMRPVRFSGDGTVEGIVIGVGDACDDEDVVDFAKVNKTKIALIRGTSTPAGCSQRMKVQRVFDAGADGVIIYETTEPVDVGLRTYDLRTAMTQVIPITDIPIPVMAATKPVGEDLESGDGNGKPAKVEIKIVTVNESRDSFNVIADSTHGDPNNVVILNAHTDSVHYAPGIGKSGTAVALLLEFAKLTQHVKPTNKVRFLFNTYHNGGPNGSRFYLESLSQEERDRIALAVDNVILGSNNGIRMTFGGVPSDPDTQVVRRTNRMNDVAQAYFGESREILRFPISVAQIADSGAFINVGIPSNSVLTGFSLTLTQDILNRYGFGLPPRVVGDATFPCFQHAAACDNLSPTNPEPFIYMEMAREQAYFMLTYAMNTELINFIKGKGNFTPENVARDLPQFDD